MRGRQARLRRLSHVRHGIELVALASAHGAAVADGATRT
jgi:hypothetical protein